MTKYQKHDGSVYEGPVLVMPDGRIKSGSTLTADSVRLFPMPERSRDADGGFQSDDPSTPEINEAWEGGKAPIKKKSRKKK